MTPDLPAGTEILTRVGPRSLLSRRARHVVLALVVVALVAGWLVDQRLRDREVARLDTCATMTRAAVEAAQGKVGFMVGYVRPALAGSPSDALRSDLYQMVSDAAVGSEDRLEAALGFCRDVSVLVVHGDLRERRASCEARIRQAVAHLDAVARDGRAAFRPSRPTTSPGGCAG